MATKKSTSVQIGAADLHPRFVMSKKLRAEVAELYRSTGAERFNLGEYFAITMARQDAQFQCFMARALGLQPLT